MLIAGVLAAGTGFLASTGDAADTQLRVTQTTTTEMPAFVKALGNLFGTGTASRDAQPPAAQTAIYSRLRSRQERADGSSLIVQCDLQRSLVVNPAAKTYYVVSFDDAARNFAAAMGALKKTMAQMMPQIHGSSTVNVSTKEQADPQTRTIAGQMAHHVVQTITVRISGTGNCPNNTIQWTNDEWYADNPLDASCPLAPVQNPKVYMQAVQGLGVAQCMRNVRASADAKIVSAKRFPLDQTMDSGMLGKTHTVVSGFSVQPYDPSLFEAPAGFTQVAAPSPAPAPTP